MSHVFIKDGTEDMIASAVDYLESRGIPREDVRALSVGGTVNGPLTIVAEIFVRAPETGGGATETEVIERVTEDAPKDLDIHMVSHSVPVADGTCNHDLPVKFNLGAGVIRHTESGSPCDGWVL